MSRRKRREREQGRSALWVRIEFLKLLGSVSPVLGGVAVLTAILGALLPVAFLLAGGELSARVQEALAAGGLDATMEALYRTFILLVGLFLLSEVLVPIQSRLRWLLMKRVDGDVRRRVMEAALRGTNMSHLHDPDFLGSMRRLRGMVHYSATPGGGAAGLIGVAREYLTVVAAGIVLATFHLGLAVFATSAALFVRLHWRAQVILLIDTWIDGIPDFNEARYFAELGLGRQSANEVRFFGLRDWFRQRIRVAGLRGWNPLWSLRRYLLARQFMVDFAVSVAAALVPLVWAVRAALDGRLEISDLVVFGPALFIVVAVGRTFDDDLALEYGGVMLPALHSIERLASESRARELGGVKRDRRNPPKIEMRKVSFRYPGSEFNVLEDVILTIPSGRSAALVGLNGAGKTTLVRLLCGLYQPLEGTVLIDGMDLQKLDLDDWHRSIAPMFQEFLRLQVSVRENVAAGSIEHLSDEQMIESALDEAEANGFARRLPDGVNSLLATTYADGTDLSGGQWQRLGVARALFALKTGARFLILDEPTSNLDTASEERLVRRLIEDTRGRATTLLVSHRLALARRADQILVVEEGRIVERGSHEELISAGGRYADAFGMQAALYPLEDSRNV